MPLLIGFLIRHFTNGFLLGAAATMAAIIAQPDAMATQLVSESPIGLVLLVFGLGSSFGMGSLATALWLEADGDA